MTAFARAAGAGCRAHVVAPAGPVPAQRFEKGLRVLRRESGLDLVVADNMAEQHGFLAGPDAMRLQLLQHALDDNDSRAVIAARGGYGCTRLLSQLNATRFAAHPQVLLGFSDITALLCWAYVAANVPSIHGPVVTQWSELAHDDVQRAVDLLRGEVPAPLVADEGATLWGGVVEGPLIVGNLEVLRALLGTPFFPDLRGVIVGFEDVNEAPYRLDRAFTQLLSSGALRGVKGVILGQFIGCEGVVPGGPSALDVATERLGRLGVPVLSGLPFGHAPGSHAALPFGVRVRLDADNGALSCLEPVCRSSST